jgi:23S rRNA pseudouridine2605 synthase
MAAERIQKVLARAGLGSRREIESWISQGLISVDGQVATLGMTLDERAQVTISGRKVHQRRLQAPQRQVLVYHKPTGQVVSRKDEENRPTVFEALPPLTQGRWIAVGRLDINTSGLMIFTTDGELAKRLMHPSYQLEREYAVRVLGAVKEEVLARLQQEIILEDGPAHFTKIVDLGGEGLNHWYRVTLSEGRNREVRRLWESQGVTVSRLMRLRFGPCSLPKGLRRSQSRLLEGAETKLLLSAVGLDTPAPQVKPSRRSAAAPPAARTSGRGERPSRTAAASTPEQQPIRRARLTQPKPRRGAKPSP